MTEQKTFQKRKYQHLNDKTYQRPEKTYTEQLTKEQIAEKLKDYIQVDDIKYVRKGAHIRYYVPDKRNPGEMKFCVGGFLKFTHDDYIMLSQSPYRDGPSWSVQLKDAIFYRKQTAQEETDRKLHYLGAELEKLRKENEELKANPALTRPTRALLVSGTMFAGPAVGKKETDRKHEFHTKQVELELNELDKLQVTPEDLEFAPIKLKPRTRRANV